MKKLTKFLTLAIMLIVVAMSLTACNLGGSSSSSNVGDAYYKYTSVDDKYETSVYFKLTADSTDNTKGTWKDSSGYAGNYKSTGNVYTLYIGQSGALVYAEVSIDADTKIFTYNGVTYKFKTAATNNCGNWSSYVMMGGLLAILIAFFVYSTISNKKKQKKAAETVSALKVGDKVKTIGGICGIVSAINDSENTFVLETGDDKHKTYTKFDKAAIYQTSSAGSETPKQEVVEKKVVKRGGKKVEEPETVEEVKEEAKVEEVKPEEKTEEPAEVVETSEKDDEKKD